MSTGEFYNLITNAIERETFRLPKFTVYLVSINSKNLRRKQDARQSEKEKERETIVSKQRQRLSVEGIKKKKYI